MNYLLGENHSNYTSLGREIEADFIKKALQVDNVYNEIEFRSSITGEGGEPLCADPIIYHQRAKLLAILNGLIYEHKELKDNYDLLLDEGVLQMAIESIEDVVFFTNMFSDNSSNDIREMQMTKFPVTSSERVMLNSSVDCGKKLLEEMNELKNINAEKSYYVFYKSKKNRLLDKLVEVILTTHKLDLLMGGVDYPIGHSKMVEIQVNKYRESQMIESLSKACEEGRNIAWKVGEIHVNNLLKFENRSGMKFPFQILTREDLKIILKDESLKVENAKMKDNLKKSSSNLERTNSKVFNI